MSELEPRGEPGSALATARAFSCGFGRRTVLRGLDFELRRGRTTAVMGPGGAGKSTLLRLLADDPPEPQGFWREGELRRIFAATPAFLRQAPTDDHRSLLERLAPRPTDRDAGAPAETERAACRRVAAVWKGCPGAERLLLATLDLPLRRLPLELRRLAEITAVVAGPTGDTPALILDEPESELDDEVAGWIESLLAELRGRTSIVLATHHLGLARRVADDVLLLIEGDLVDAGPTPRIFEDPRNERTRTYVRMGS